MPTSTHYQAKRQITVIESARGFAALYVLVTHVIELSGIHSTLADGSPLLLFINLFLIYGHQAVLLFFVLSGFSIHYASVDRDLTRTAAIRQYYYLRWRRIYPIFLLAVCLTIGLDIAGSALGITIYQQQLSELSYQQLLFTLSFLTDVHDVAGVIQPVLHSNGPLWSLSYEVIYYLIYPLYWYINRRFGIGGTLILGIVSSIASFTAGKLFAANHFLNVLDLYAIWCLGATLAAMHRRNYRCSLPMPIHASIIYILLQSAWILENAVYTVGAFFDITWGLFFFFIMLLYFRTEQISDMRLGKKTLTLIISISGYLVIIAGVERFNFVSNTTLFYSHISLTLALFIFGLSFRQLDIQSISNNLLKPVYSFGKSSYGIYVIHYPILLFSTQALVYFKHSVWWCLAIIPVILIAASFIEDYYQAFITGYFDPIAQRIGLMKKAGI